jgi:hypothetical protein
VESQNEHQKEYPPALLDSVRRQREAALLQREIEASFPPPGALGLPRLLDDKRCKYGIPASAWDAQTVFNKIYVWQIKVDDSETYGGGLILKTEEARARELNEAPRGVIVSAGLQALDELRSHGVDIGHTISFAHSAPFRKRLPRIDGKQPSLIILHAGDVIDSEELAQNLKKRVCRVITREVDGAIEHYFCDENGKTWNPAQNVAAEDS